MQNLCNNQILQDILWNIYAIIKFYRRFYGKFMQYSNFTGHFMENLCNNQILQDIYTTIFHEKCIYRKDTSKEYRRS